MSKLTLIEFTQDTGKRRKGFRFRVDPMSAESFCDRQKVARRVGQLEPAPEPAPAPAPAPEPEPVPEPEPGDV